MNAAITLPHTDRNANVNLDTLMGELDHYRRQSAWLRQVNALHARLACATDLQGMVEAFSVWLTPHVAHDLMAYRSVDGERLHMMCSCHGPERRLAMDVANEFFAKIDCQAEDGCCAQDGFYVQQWRMEIGGQAGCLMLLRQGNCIEDEEAEVMEQVLPILAEPMQRALDYEDLFDQARRDLLTGLANRRVFDEQIGPIMDTSRRHGHPLTVASMDLDHFKEINDTLGHAAGDEALRQVAEVMSHMVRNSDLLVRMGGDEFVLVLPNTDAPAARILAERLCAAVDRLELNSGHGTRLGISIGLIQWQPDMDRDEWLQRADEILYQAKKTGRCRVCMEGMN